jgi:hypothetical protein
MRPIDFRSVERDLHTLEFQYGLHVEGTARGPLFELKVGFHSEIEPSHTSTVPSRTKMSS